MVLETKNEIARLIGRSEKRLTELRRELDSLLEGSTLESATSKIAEVEHLLDAIFDKFDIL